MARVTAFPGKLFELANDSTTDAVVHWSPSGESIVIVDVAVFMAEIVPGNFKLTKFESFHRQMNAYGFNKVRGATWEFENPNFKRDQPQLLVNMKRNNPRRRVQNNEIQQENVELMMIQEDGVGMDSLFNHGAAAEIDWDDINLFDDAYFPDS